MKTKFAVESIDHLVLNVSDVERAAKWYQEVLGMKREDSAGKPGRPNRTMVRFGTQKINLRPIATSQDEWFTGAHVHTGGADLCFETKSSPEEILRHLGRFKVAIELGPVIRSGARGDMTSVYCRDPDGNLIEISVYNLD